MVPPLQTWEAHRCGSNALMPKMRIWTLHRSPRTAVDPVPQVLPILSSCQQAGGSRMQTNSMPAHCQTD